MNNKCMCSLSLLLIDILCHSGINEGDKKPWQGVGAIISYSPFVSVHLFYFQSKLGGISSFKQLSVYEHYGMLCFNSNR